MSLYRYAHSDICNSCTRKGCTKGCHWLPKSKYPVNYDRRID